MTARAEEGGALGLYVAEDHGSAIRTWLVLAAVDAVVVLVGGAACEGGAVGAVAEVGAFVADGLGEDMTQCAGESCGVCGGE